MPSAASRTGIIGRAPMRLGGKATSGGLGGPLPDRYYGDPGVLSQIFTAGIWGHPPDLHCGGLGVVPQIFIAGGRRLSPAPGGAL
jgi:hypothetical protein